MFYSTKKNLRKYYLDLILQGVLYWSTYLFIEYHTQKVDNNLGFYHCERTDKSYNVSIHQDFKKIIVQNNFRKETQISKKLLDTTDHSLVKSKIKNVLKLKDRVNCKIEKGCFLIYTYSLIADEIYFLQNPDNEITNFETLLDKKVVIDHKYLSKDESYTLIYLALHGYFEECIFVLYSHCVLLYTPKNTFETFFIDVKDILNLDTRPLCNHHILTLYISNRFLEYTLNQRTDNTRIAFKLQESNSFDSFISKNLNKKISSLVNQKKYFETIEFFDIEEFRKKVDEHLLPLFQETIAWEI